MFIKLFSKINCSLLDIHGLNESERTPASVQNTTVHNLLLICVSPL